MGGANCEWGEVEGGRERRKRGVMQSFAVHRAWNSNWKQEEGRKRNSEVVISLAAPARLERCWCLMGRGDEDRADATIEQLEIYREIVFVHHIS